jgi:hypothetical protein
MPMLPLHSSACSRRQFVTAFSAALFIVGHRAHAASADSEFRNAQIEALQTGDSSKLKEIEPRDTAYRLARDWTVQSATQLHAQSPKLPVSRDSAGMLSEFIFQGGRRFVSERRTSEQDAARELQRFVEKMIGVGIRNKRISEASFIEAKSLCPVWPFC